MRTAWPSTTPSTPRPGRLRKPVTGGSRPSSARAAAATARATGMLARVLERSGEPEHLGPRGAVQRHDLDELERARGDGAGLVEHDGVDAAGLLEHLGAPDQDPELRAAPGADHQRRRRGEAERARAGDDQHGDRRAERRGGARRRRRASATSVASETDDHDRDEDGRDTVDEPLDRRLARLRLGDEARDLRERGLGADPRRAHDEAPVGVERRADDLVAGADLDRDGLAGEHRLVDRRLAELDDAVGGDLLARPHDESVADAELVDGHEHLLSAAQHARLLRAQLEQRADRLARAAAGARLEVAAEQDQRRDHRGDLEVGVGVDPGEQDDDRPRPRRERAERDQRVHRRGAVAQVAAPRRGGTASRPRTRPASRARARATPSPELERRRHREHDERGGERGRDERGARARPGSDPRPATASAGSEAW